MPGRIVEIAEPQRHLALYRGFMIVSHNKEELGRVALDQIEAVIAYGHGTTQSNNLLAALAERGIPYVLCAANYMPVAMFLATEKNYHQAKRIQAQLAATKPLQKSLWKALVKAKITMQAQVLAAVGENPTPVKKLVAKVKSGDVENHEAQAAKLYWVKIFGDHFKRDRALKGINALLNYGYTIIRSATARGVIAAGLHPSIGIHHRNHYNATCLVDDLIEPFRALVDLRVYGLVQNKQTEIDKHSKSSLVHLLSTDLPTAQGISTVAISIQKLTTSLAQVYLKECKTLHLPGMLDELTLDAIKQGR